MSNTSSRTVQVQFSGNISTDVIQSALDNNVSPAVLEIVTLISGNNAITPPIVSGVVVTGLTIIPPAGNLVIITLKGINGDTGIPLHLTDPCSLSLDPSFTGLVLSAGGANVIGIQLIWS